MHKNKTVQFGHLHFLLNPSGCFRLSPGWGAHSHQPSPPWLQCHHQLSLQHCWHRPHRGAPSVCPLQQNTKLFLKISLVTENRFFFSPLVREGQLISIGSNQVIIWDRNSLSSCAPTSRRKKKFSVLANFIAVYHLHSNLGFFSILTLRT